MDRAELKKLLKQGRSHAEIKQLELEKIIKRSKFSRSLCLQYNQLTNLPDSIGTLWNLTNLELQHNELICIPETVGNLSNLINLDLSRNQLNSLPNSIGNLYNLIWLYLYDNKLTSLPHTFTNLTKLKYLYINGNPLTDLSILNELPNLQGITFLGVDLPCRYWMKFSDWKPEWLLDEDNAEIRRVLIDRVGYEKICEELNAITLDTWREYTLLSIDEIEDIYDEAEENILSKEPMVLLKMTCPSTSHIHILRVPPEMTSAEAAITWVNHGIHPDLFSVQT
jgi:leucine-rich repeat protein SHOC2